MRSRTDLLWHDQHPVPPPGPKPNRAAFTRYLPSHNKGKATSSETLSKIAARQANDPWNRAFAARAPARMVVKISRNVVEMCEQYGIDTRDLMREGANPLRDEVNLIHGPYTPSWEYALGTTAEPGKDPDAPPIDGDSPASPGGAPSSARSAPAGSGRKAPGRERAKARRKASIEAMKGEDGVGSSSARALRVRPKPEDILDEHELEATTKQVQREMEELRKRRADAMKRRAAVHLAQQRRMAVSIELEREQETWRTERREKEQRKQEVAAAATKKHIIEVEAQRQKAKEKELVEAETQAEALRQRWAEQEARVAEHKAAVKASREARAELEDRRTRTRFELEEKRANARAMAVAEYEEARVEGEKEAEQRAAEFLEEKRQAAIKRVEEYTKRRDEARGKKAASIEEYERQMEVVRQERIERELIVDQQISEFLEQPHKNLEKHQRDLKRREAAPAEVVRLDTMRERRLEAGRGARDEIVEQNRQQHLIRHMQWVRARQSKRASVIKKIDKAAHERMAKTVQHAESVQKYEAHVQKMQAKKALRDAIIKQERDAFHYTQAKVVEAVATSRAAGGDKVISDGAIESVIAGPGTKKKK